MMFSWFQASFNTLFTGGEMAQRSVVSVGRNIHLHHTLLYPHGVRLHRPPGRLQAFSAMAVEDPAVRGAIQDATVEVAASQRDAFMGGSALHRL